MSSIKPIAYLFPRTSRAQTPNAPPYDGTRDVKSWIDPNPGSGPNVTYQTLDSKSSIVNLTIPVSEASTLNAQADLLRAEYDRSVAAADVARLTGRQ